VSYAIRVGIVDSHPMFREAVAQTLTYTAGIEVVGEGATAAAALKVAEELRPDVMLLEIYLPGGGVEAVANIARACPSVRTVMLTLSENEFDVVSALQAGARGYVLKTSTGTEVVETVRAIFRGESYVPPQLAAKLLLTLQRQPTKKRRARTTIGKAFLKNHIEIELCARLFLLAIDEKIKLLRENRANHPEKISERDQTIADLEDLKCRVEAFLSVTSQFAAKKAKEASVVETTTSFAAGIQNWWAKDHVQICRQSALMMLFGIGVATCSLAGAGGVLAVGISGALVGGKPVVDAIKAVANNHIPTQKDHWNLLNIRLIEPRPMLSDHASSERAT